jgi:hypothetical protein
MEYSKAGEREGRLTIEFPKKTVIINEDVIPVVKRYNMDASLNRELNNRIEKSKGQDDLIDGIIKDGRLDMLIMLAYVATNPTVLRLMSRIQKFEKQKN